MFTMASVDFCYATMGAGKTIEACKTAFNYVENNLTPLCLMPSVDTRAGDFKSEGEFLVGKWESRMPGVSRDVYVIPKGASITSFIKEVSKLFASKIDVVIIDEVQFLTKEQVEELFRLALYQDLPIKTFGLLTNFQTELFEGSKRLIELGANQIALHEIGRASCRERV